METVMNNGSVAVLSPGSVHVPNLMDR